MTTKPIRFIAIGDPHIAKRHLALSQEAMDNSLKLVQENAKNIDMVVVMGDILDRHDDVKLTYMKMARDWIIALSKVKMTIVLMGNHDRPSNQDIFSDIHPFMDVKDVDKTLYIVDKPKAIALNRFKAGEKDARPQGKNHWLVLFMPYLPPGTFQDSFQRYLDAMHKTGGWKQVQSIESFDLIFAHQEFKGAPYGPIISTKGDPWPDHYPFVISGHIHTRTYVGDNIYYTGSLYPTNISESRDKGLILGTFYPDRRSLETQVIPVVQQVRATMEIALPNQDAISEMVILDRENTRYIVTGTSEQVAEVKAQIKAKGKTLDVIYDIRPLKPDGKKYADFDTMIRERAKDQDVVSILGEIMQL